MNALKCSLCEVPRTFPQNINKIDSNEEGPLCFITFNVWFNEELQIEARMKAIGGMIECNGADIVCLQEVTPLILNILQSAPWYKRNGYMTVLPLAAKKLPYFNVILTKHRFVRGQGKFIPFSNS